MSAPSGWDGLLDEGEQILWQGRPDQGFHFRLDQIAVTLFGLVFAGFALFWMVLASMAGGGFWMFGLIHFSVGLAIVGGSLFGDTYRRRNTWYTLTDRRAFVATRSLLKGRQLRSFPITAETMLDYHPGEPATVNFGLESRRGNKGRIYNVEIGFERIAEGEKVYRLLRDIKRAAAVPRAGKTR